MLFATFIVTRHLIAPMKNAFLQKMKYCINHKMQSDQNHKSNPIAFTILILINDIRLIIYAKKDMNIRKT